MFKVPKLPKLGNRGAAHIIAPLLTIVGVAAVGTYVLVASHAATVTPIAYLSQAGSTNTSLVESLNTIDPGTNAVKLLASASGSQTVVAPASYSPDHKYLAWSNNVGLQYYVTIQTLATGAKKTVALPPNVAVSYIDDLIEWFPQSTKLAFASLVYNSTTKLNSYGLWTLNTDGTGLTKLMSSTTAQIGTFAPSGDGKSLVYAAGFANQSYDGVYSIAPGGTPIKVHTGFCNTVRSIYGGSVAVVYSCNTSTNNAINVYKSNPGSANATLIHSFANSYVANGIWYSIRDIAPAANGSKLALLMEKGTEVNPTACTYMDQLQISTLPIAANSAVSTVYSGASSGPGGGCYGGGGSDSYQLQWSSDLSSIAYLKWTPFNQPAGTSLNLLTLSTKSTRQLVAAPVSSISW